MISRTHEGYVFLFAADEPKADVIAGISKYNIYIVAELPRNLKRMLNEELSKLQTLIFWSDTERSEGKNFLSVPGIILKP